MPIARRHFLPLLALALVGATARVPDHAATAPFATRATADGPVYELRTYTAHPGKLPNVLARFRDHTTKLFEKHGIKNVGYFTPLDSANGAGEKLVYVIEHASLDAAKASWRAFAADPEWQKVAKASEADGPIVAKVESVFMSATDYSPGAFASDGRTRVFEMRTYTTPDGKLENLDARFRDHTINIFTRLHMTSVAYWHPTDSANGAGKTLIYILAHPSREAAKANWATFRTDPEWVAARTESEKGGPLTTDVKSVYMTPTDFSTLH